MTEDDIQSTDCLEEHDRTSRREEQRNALALWKNSEVMTESKVRSTESSNATIEC